MNCQKAREQINDTLAAGEVKLAGELAVHLQGCEACRAFHSQQRQLFRDLDSGLNAIANETIPPSLLPGVRVRLEVARPTSPWIYRLAPIGTVLIVAALIALPVVRHAIRHNGVQEAVNSKPSDQNNAPRQMLLEQPEQSANRTTAGVLPVRRAALPPAEKRKTRAAAVPILVDPEESQAILELAATVREHPAWAEAMVHPAAEPSSEMLPIAPIAITDLEVKPLAEEDQQNLPEASGTQIHK